jgi:hypothetical protein
MDCFILHVNNMKRALFTLAFLLLAGCGTYVPQSIAAVTPQATAKPTRQATSTPVPTATIGYQETAIVAQQTADEARRVNAVVTAQFEQRIQEQLQMTAQYEQRVQQVYSWTQQAAQTVIPLTATQQAFVNHSIPTQQALLVLQTTQTAEYPSLIIKAEDAKNHQKYGEMNYVISMIALSAMTLLMIVGMFALVRFIKTHPLPSEMEEDEETEPVANKSFRIDVHDGNGHSEIHDIPGTPEEFEELAIALTSGLRNLEINRWQREGDVLKDGIKRFRSWARDTKIDGKDLVIVMPQNELAPTATFRELCRSYLESHTLPDGLKFIEQEQDEQGSGYLDGLTLLHSPSDSVSS